MQRHELDRESSALHEAGHVVVADYLGFTVKAVDIEANDQWWGRTVLSPDPDTAGVAGAAVFAAGRIAERLVLAGRERGPKGSRLGPETAGEDVPSCLEPSEGDTQGGTDRQRELQAAGRTGARFAYRTAARILTRRWATVQAVAGALLERGALEREELEALLQAPRPTREAPRVIYDAGATVRGLYYGDGGRPAWADEYREPEPPERLRVDQVY